MTPQQTRDYLLVHAADMGGWLSADGCLTDNESKAMYRLAAANLFTFVTGGGPDRWQLTETGWGVANDLRAQR